jgi:hypothetical protein
MGVKLTLGSTFRDAVSQVSVIRIFALTFAFFSLFFAIFGFRNIPLIQVFVLWAFYVMPPLVFVLRSCSISPKGNKRSARLSAVGQGILAAGIFSYFLISGISERWRNYFGNFADERFQVGGGYSIDSAFHIALIEGILDSGLPSTGLHGQPPLAYHTMSHYVDAAAAFLTQVSPWEAYSLVFVLKNTALILALVYAITRMARGFSEGPILLLAAFTYLPFYNLGYLVGSHANWFPALLVLMLFPRIWTRLTGSNPLGWGVLVEMSFYIVLLSLGKISMGFGLALFIGLKLLVGKGNLSARGLLKLGLMASFWVGWFLLLAQAFQADRDKLEFVDRLDRVWPHIWFFVFAILIHLLIWLVSARRVHIEAAGVSLGTLAVLFLVVAVVVTTKRADVFLFFLASSTITILMSIATFVSDTPGGVRRKTTNSPSPPSTPLSGALILLLIAGAPLTAESPQIADFKPKKILGNLESANTWTYEWYNESAEGTPMSVLGAIRGGTVPGTKTFLGAGRAKVREAEKSSEGEMVYVFIPSEGFEYLIEEFGRENLREDQSADIALMIRAALGAPLVFGSNKQLFTDDSFGFSVYPDDLVWLGEDEVNEDELCRFGGRVLLLQPENLEKSALLCRHNEPRK